MRDFLKKNALEPEQFCEASSKNGSGRLQTEEIPDIQPYRMEMSLTRRQPRKIHLCRSSVKPLMPAIVFEIVAKSTRLDHFLQGAESITPAT